MGGAWNIYEINYYKIFVETLRKVKNTHDTF